MCHVISCSSPNALFRPSIDILGEVFHTLETFSTFNVLCHYMLLTISAYSIVLSETIQCVTYQFPNIAQILNDGQNSNTSAQTWQLDIPIVLKFATDLILYAAFLFRPMCLFLFSLSCRGVHCTPFPAHSSPS